MAETNEDPTGSRTRRAAETALPSLREVFSAERVFWCNTNRGAPQAGPHDLEEQMHQRSVVAAWVAFNYPEHMLRVRRGDAIFAYAKQLGIIGVGVARESRVEILAPDHPERIRAFEYGEHEQEWRVPVEWLAWDESAPCSVQALLPAFQEITDHPDRIALVRQHFLG